MAARKIKTLVCEHIAVGRSVSVVRGAHFSISRTERKYTICKHACVASHTHIPYVYVIVCVCVHIAQHGAGRIFLRAQTAQSLSALCAVWYLVCGFLRDVREFVYAHALRAASSRLCVCVVSINTHKHTRTHKLLTCAYVCISGAAEAARHTHALRIQVVVQARRVTVCVFVR